MSNSVEALIREKLKAALETQKKRVAGSLLVPPQPPPPVKEAYEHSNDGPNIYYQVGDHVVINRGPDQGTKGKITKNHGEFFHDVSDSAGKHLGIFHQNDLHKDQYVKEAFSRNGRPVSAAPSENAGERRQRLQLKIAKLKLKLQSLQQEASRSKDARGMNARMQITRTELSLAQQKLATVK